MFKQKLQWFVLGTIITALSCILILSVSSSSSSKSKGNFDLDDVELIVTNQGFISAIESIRLGNESVMSFANALVTTFNYKDGGETQTLIKNTADSIKKITLEKPYDLIDSYIKIIEELDNDKI